MSTGSAATPVNSFPKRRPRLSAVRLRGKAGPAFCRCTEFGRRTRTRWGIEKFGFNWLRFSPLPWAPCRTASLAENRCTASRPSENPQATRNPGAESPCRARSAGERLAGEDCLMAQGRREYRFARLDTHPVICKIQGATRLSRVRECVRDPLISGSVLFGQSPFIPHTGSCVDGAVGSARESRGREE